MNKIKLYLIQTLTSPFLINCGCYDDKDKDSNFTDIVCNALGFKKEDLIFCVDSEISKKMSDEERKKYYNDGNNKLNVILKTTEGKYIKVEVFKNGVPNNYSTDAELTFYFKGNKNINVNSSIVKEIESLDKIEDSDKRKSLLFIQQMKRPVFGADFPTDKKFLILK